MFARERASVQRYAFVGELTRNDAVDDDVAAHVRSRGAYVFRADGTAVCITDVIKITEVRAAMHNAWYMRGWIRISAA